MSMPVITLTSPSKKSVSSPPEIKRSTRDASFSSYLDGAEETFVLKLGHSSTQSLTPSISTQQDFIFLETNEADDREIDVFDAKKYFNEGLNHSPKVGPKNSSSHQQKRDEPFETLPTKHQPKISRPSIRSESSGNSRSALLHKIPRNQQPSKLNKKSFLACIGCNCSCSDKNSVDIDDYEDENCTGKSSKTGLGNCRSQQGDKTRDHSVKKSYSGHNCVRLDEPGLRVNSERHFSFPVLNSKTGNQAAKMQIQEDDDVAKKKPIEVFGSPVLENRKNNLSQEKKSTMITWDVIAPGVAEEIKMPPIPSEIQSDGGSDASSDLFEIESLSKGNPFLSREASDGLSGSMTPRTCYAPSEASIEWSVITASAADFSVPSDSEELGFASTAAIPRPQKVGQNSKTSSFREIPKLRPSILSGCKSQKAVSVAGDAQRRNEHGFSTARRHLRAESLTTRFHDDNKVAGFGAKNRPQSFDNPRVPSQSRSGRAMHVLYT